MKRQLVCLLCLLAVEHVMAETWISSTEYATCRVVLGEGAPEHEREAADLFVKYWKACTGFDAAVSDAPSDGLNVWVGASGLAADLGKKAGLDALGADGIRIFSVDYEKPGKHLILAGEGVRGTLYAVFEFFDRFMGVRWLTPDTTHIPPAPSTLAAMDVAYAPVFEHRDSSYFQGGDAVEFNRAHRISRQPAFGLFVHTAYTIVSPDKYKDHPEYFALVNGTRRVPAGIVIKWPEGIGPNIDRIGQLCWTNSELPDVIFNELKEHIRKKPGARIWSVSQMDWSNNCECEACRAVDEREGSPAGSLLVGINAVAERLEREYPGHYIETLAYTYTRKAPKTIKPRDNVIIRLCSIECDFARPLDDPSADANLLFAQDIRDWSAISKTLYIWDYTPNFRNFLSPHPNFHVLQPNLAFFAAHNVKGMFEQGYHGLGGEFGHLRRYIIGKCMWDPSADATALRDEFLRLYYGEAAPHLAAYIELITRRVLDSGHMMTCFDPLPWIDAATVEEARGLFRLAFEALSDETLRARLVEASLPVEFAAMVCAPRIEYSEDSLTISRPESMDREHFIHLAKSFGMTEPVEAFGWDRFRDIYNEQQYPKRLTSSLEKLENDAYELWVTPSLQGSIIRFRDKRRDLELLQGFRKYGSAPSTWEEWTDTPGILERPIASTYSVKEKTSNHVSIETTTDKGLRISRSMRLPAGSLPLEVELTIENPTDQAILPQVKIHPEFYTQGQGLPQVWVHDGSAWLHLNKDADPRLAAFGAYRERDNTTRQAFSIPSRNFTLVNAFDPANVGSLLYFFNIAKGAEQVNLEVLPVREELAPGAKRTVRSTYYVVDGTPASTGFADGSEGR